MSIHLGNGGHRFSGLNIRSKHLTAQSSDRDTKIFEICLKLRIKTPARHKGRNSCIFIVNF